MSETILFLKKLANFDFGYFLSVKLAKAKVKYKNTANDKLKII
jgi:hypothetical protein